MQHKCVALRGRCWPLKTLLIAAMLKHWKVIKTFVAASKSGRKELIMWELDFECTGDYGLSDCLFVTEEAWDFAEAFCDFSWRNKDKENNPIDYDEDDLPF